MSEDLNAIDAFIAAIRPTYDKHPSMAQFAHAAYWEQFREMGIPFDSLLKKVLENYERIPRFFRYEQEGNEFVELIQTCPNVLFSIATQLEQKKKYAALGRGLQVAGVGNLLVNDLPGTFAIQRFLQSVDETDNAEELEAKLEDSTNTYFPRMVSEDLVMIGKKFQIHATQNKEMLIGNHFLTAGLLQIFLKYYFDLLSQAQSDEISDHITIILSPFLAKLKQQEQNLWANVRNADILQVQIDHLIEQNKHPYYFKDRLHLLKIYHPLVREKDNSNHPRFQQQLKIWLDFSIKKMILFLNEVNECKGPQCTLFLLQQLRQFNDRQFLALVEYLSEHKTQYQAIYLLVQRMLPKKKRRGSKKKKHAVDPNINYDIQSWGPHLQRFYQQIQMSGVLSEDQLPVFFRGFAESALQMLREKEITEETNAKFKKSLNDLMDQCVQRSSLNTQEIKIYQNRIEREIQSIEGVDHQERAKKIDSIGLVLYEAKKKQEEYERNYREALPVELTVHDEKQRVNFTVESLVLLPLPNRQKERLLETYVPSRISDTMMMAIYNLNLTNPDGPEVSESVYDIGKYTKLKTTKLIHLLEISEGFEGFAKKALIPLEAEKELLKTSIQEFFLFPLSSRGDEPDDPPFEQHLKYLSLQIEKNAFPLYAYEIILNNLNAMPLVQYLQYFNIFQKEQLVQSKLEAVVGLWKNPGLEKLKA